LRRLAAAPIFSGMNSIRLLLNRLLGRKTILETTLFAQSVRLAVEGRQELRQMRLGPEQKELVGRMLEHLAPSDTVYDVGANIGLISLLLAGHASGPDARVHSFEPEPTNFSHLCRNVELNGLAGRILPHQLALGSEEGEAELFVRGGPGEGRHSTVAQEGSTGSIRVPLTTLARFARSLDDPQDLIKIDVEGAEGRVLAGKEGLLPEGRPRELFLELHPKGDGDRMPGGEPIREWLTERGFRLAWEGEEGSRTHCHYR
jgi:FkbM family methyltransferase